MWLPSQTKYPKLCIQKLAVIPELGVIGSILIVVTILGFDYTMVFIS